MRLVAIILFAACGSRDAETPSASGASSNTQSAAAATEEAVPAEAPQDPGPVPVVELATMTDDDGLSLRLRVPGPEGVELRRRVQIERREGESWTAVEAPYALRTGCEDTEEECIALAAGAELRAPSTGLTGQCGAAGLSAGEHRFVVESCAPDGSRPHRIEGEFTVETSPRP